MAHVTEFLEPGPMGGKLLRRRKDPVPGPCGTGRTAIPPFETGAAILRRAASIYRPKEHLSVSEWADRHISHYDPDALPFLAEIMDAFSSAETAEVGDMGPAQGGKSLIGEACIGWSIEHDPADFMVCQPDKAMMQDFVIRRINPLVAGTPALKAQLLPIASADNIFLKQFRGMLLTSIWPVAAQFRARPVPRGWIDDFDQIDDDIEGQGNAIKLLDGRMTTFEGRDKKLISSSPAREDGGGIEAFIAGGTDERLMPVCPQCEERIELDLKRDLRFEGASLDQAEKTAHVVCPANGCILEPPARRQLLDSCADLPGRGFVARHPDRGPRRRTFRRDGLLAFTTWGKLARDWCEAKDAWESRQDESGLRTFFNVKAGQNYRSILAGEKPIEAADLLDRREQGWLLGTVPAGPRVLIVSVDVQHDRFELAGVGFGDGLEKWLFDRWAIHALGDGLTGLRPFTHPEHWAVLLSLFSRTWPMADGSGRSADDLRRDPDAERSPPPLTVVVDTGGSDQAAEGAKRFFEMARAAGVHPSRITLVKGGNNPNGKLMPPAQFADQKLKGGPRRNSARLWMPNVHALKNILDARLRRDKPGPGYLHLPEDLEPEHVEEITAEQLEGGKWKKIRNRNETLDLIVYAIASLLRPPFAGSRSHMRWVPKDFRLAEPPKAPAPAAEAPEETEENSNAEAPGAGGAAVEPAEAAPPPAAETEPEPTPRPRPRPRRQRTSHGTPGWMRRLKH